MHGFIVIDKAAGITSAGVVAQVKKMLPKGTKIGHCGTLDPNVTGVLALAIGKATKAIPYLSDEIKRYQCSMRFGIKTTTADIWGEVLERREAQTAFSIAAINNALRDLTGKIEQLPPMFSAAKIEGRRLYQLARAGQTIARKAKQIEVFGYSDIRYDYPDLHFTVSCSRGSYVRTLCEQIAAQLNSVATMTALRRLQSGPFQLSDAHDVTLLNSTLIKAKLLPITILFKQLRSIYVDYKHALHLTHGVKVNLARFINKTESFKGDERFAVYYKTIFIGVASRRAAEIRIEKLFLDSDSLQAYTVGII